MAGSFLEEPLVSPQVQAPFDDGQVFAITTFVALRLAFSTANDALGAQPDAHSG